MNDRLCVIPGCRELGEHLDDCTSDRCKGCRPRPVESGFVCASDRVRIAVELAEIPELAAQLAEEHDPGGWKQGMRVPQPTTDPDRLPPWVWLARGAQLALVMPAGVTRVSNQARVSGTREQPAPVSLDRLDLAGGARRAHLTIAGRAHLDDQTGHLSVAAVLDSWARDWRDMLYPDHHLPVPTVPELVTWLSNRLHDACDAHPTIDDFATEIHELRGALQRTLGLTIRPIRERCEGVACKSCDRMALYREGGLVSCGYCGLHYSEAEYAAWVGLLAGQARRIAA